MVIKALPGHTIAFKTSQSLVEGDFVVISGSEDLTVEKATAAGKADGIVVVPPEHGMCTVLLNKPIVEVTAGDAVTAGQDVEIHAGGGVAPVGTGEKVGVALKTATAGNKTWVALTV